MTSGRPPWQILGDGQPGAEDEQGKPEQEEGAAATAGPERAGPAKAAVGAGQAPSLMLPAATATAETYLPVEAPVTAIAVAPPVALDVDGNDPFWA